MPAIKKFVGGCQHSLGVVEVGKGATLEFLLARAIAARPIDLENRAMAISTIRRFYACGFSPKARANLALVSRRGMCAHDLGSIVAETFTAEN